MTTTKKGVARFTADMNPVSDKASIVACFNHELPSIGEKVEVVYLEGESFFGKVLERVSEDSFRVVFDD